MQAGGKEAFVVGLCVRDKEGRGAFSAAGSKELRGDADSSGYLQSLCWERCLSQPLTRKTRSLRFLSRSLP